MNPHFDSQSSSFLIEFKIGRKKQQSVADDVLLKKKDELIGKLRADLDECRVHAKAFVDKLDEREKMDAAQGVNGGKLGLPTETMVLIPTQETGDSSKEIDVSTPKETTEQLLKLALAREDELKEHLLALQSFAGVDFVPATTKVPATTLYQCSYPHKPSLYPPNTLYQHALLTLSII